VDLLRRHGLLLRQAEIGERGRASAVVCHDRTRTDALSPGVLRCHLQEAEAKRNSLVIKRSQGYFRFRLAKRHPHEQTASERAAQLEGSQKGHRD
jgi:hypothetical protein